MHTLLPTAPLRGTSGRISPHPSYPIFGVQTPPVSISLSHPLTPHLSPSPYLPIPLIPSIYLSLSQYLSLSLYLFPSSGVEEYEGW